MAKPQTITCRRNKCWKVQEWRGQKECIHCGERLNDWDVGQQLMSKQYQFWEQQMATPKDEEDGS